jgi:DNA (cytosine-5)-methyltransferase 1
MGQILLILSRNFPFAMKSLSDEALVSARRFLSVKEIARTLNRSEGTVYRWLEKGGADPLIIPALNARLNSNGEGTPNPEFTFIDLFAGIGGIRKGFEAHGGRCVWTSEWDKYSVQTYKANFPDCHEIAGDITKVDAANIPDHDVLLGGFPCQPFSLAGVSKKNALGKLHGFLDETQGTLFFDVARIIDQKRPKAFMLENVKNLLSHDKGKTFAVIQRTLEGLGYKLHCRIINAIHWVPQHRQRIIIVGFREAVPFTWKDLREPEFGPKLGSILHTPEESAEFPYTEVYRNKTRVAPKYTLTDHLWAYLQNYAKKHAAKGNGFGCSVVGPTDTTRTLSARYHKDGSEILVSQGKDKNPRRLTPRECARLMGFDTPGSTPMIIPVSDTQAYRQFGNSVAVPVFREVARIMVPHLAGIGEASADRPSGLLPYAYQPELMAV